MVHVRSILRVLVAAALVTTMSVHAADTETQTVEVATTCVAPDVVSKFETRVESLEQERDQWQSKLTAATTAWGTEKDALEQQLAKAQEDAAKQVATLEKQLLDGESTAKFQLKELQATATALEATIAELRTQLSAKKEALSKREVELTDAQATIMTNKNLIKHLERELKTTRKANDALRGELAKLDEKLTISSLLSSYYDEGVVLAGNAIKALREQLDSTQRGAGATGISQALEALETYKKTVVESTDKLYAEHLAATLDPIIADLQRASEPYVQQYQPIVEAELANAQKQVTETYKHALRRAKAARADAIKLLKQNDGVAAYAQQIVDGSLVVLAAPLAYLLLRIALALTWLFIRTTLCVVTFGFCCGRCCRKRKLKRKTSRKSGATPPPAAPSTTPTPASSAKTSNDNKRSNGKKQK